MSKIAIVAIGSHGDVAPLAGVGQRLQQAGHDVVLVAYERFAGTAACCGLRFRPLAAAEDDGADPRKAIMAFLSPSGMRALGEGVLAALRDEPAEALLLSPFAEMAGHPLAEARGIPAVGVRLQPFSATSAYPPAVLGAWSAGSFGNRLASDTGAWAIDRLYSGVVAGFRQSLGLAKSSPCASRKRRAQARQPILHGYSPSVLPKPDDWGHGVDVVGYWWPSPPPEWQPPAELVDFLAAGPAPVFVGFGSTMTTAHAAERVTGVVLQALRRAGVRGVVQSGWAGLAAAGDDVLAIGEVPHSWLFPQTAAVAHHCGAGTAAAALRAGVPTVAMPGLGDQPFWARRLRDLGASAATIPQRSLTSDKLAEGILGAISDQRFRATAQRLAERLAAEDGAARVLDVVEGLSRASHQ